MAQYEISDWLWDLFRIGVPSVGAAVLVFKAFGDHWMNSHFETQLQNLKHEQQKELEDVRLSIQLMHGRVTKIHEREFEVLPKAWLMIHSAYGEVANVLKLTLISYPNLDLMSAAEVDELLTKTTLAQWQKDELKQSKQRSQYYKSAYERIQSDNAHHLLLDLNNFLVQHRIFMGAGVGDKFRDTMKKLNSALINYEVGHEAKDRDLKEKSYSTMKDMDGHLAEIESQIQKRLHYEDA